MPPYQPSTAITSKNRVKQVSEENNRLLEATTEVRELYQWQQYNLQIQHQREIEQYQQALAQLQAAEAANVDQIKAQKEQLTVEYDRLQQERERLIQEQILLDQHYESQQQSLQDREQALAQQQSEIEAHLQAQEAALNEQEQMMLQRFEQEWAEREEFYAQIADAAIQESHSLKQPDYPQGHTHEELLACEAIRCLYEHSIIVKSPVVQGLKGGRFELRFKILPVLADHKIASPVRSLGEAYKQINRDLIKPLRIAVRGCCADPLIEPIDGGLKLIFDVSGTDWDALEQERKAQADVIADPPPTYLAAFVRDNPQICLMGDSGEGKTTLINNLAHLMEQELGSEAQLYIVNPKPNEETDLGKLKYADFESSILGLLEAATEILYRLDLNTKALLKRREVPDFPLPQFSPLIYFFDEFSELAGVWNKCKPDVMEEVLSEFESMLAPEKSKAMEFIRKRVAPNTFAADLLKFCWRVGRTEKVKLLIAGQNLKAGTIGTTIQDLNQTAIIYLGEAIREGIDNRVSSWQRESLNRDYAHRSQKVAEGKANRFYGLFVPKGSKAYFSTLPSEGFFLTQNSSSPGTEPPEQLAPDAPDAPGIPEAVQELERLWHLPLTDHAPGCTEEACTRTDGVPRQFDPLAPEITPQLTEAVLKNFEVYQSQQKVIERVWNVTKSGTSVKYRAAKWKFRRILNKHHRPLPGKAWGQDPDDLRNFNELN